VGSTTNHNYPVFPGVERTGKRLGRFGNAVRRTALAALQRADAYQRYAGQKHCRTRPNGHQAPGITMREQRPDQRCQTTGQRGAHLIRQRKSPNT